MCDPGHIYKTHKAMKKLIIMSALLISSFSYKAADAQVRVNLNVNLGSQPSWGPSGYQHVEYYYLPDIQAYYHVPTRKYTYQHGNRWVYSKSLPKQYRNYDLYRGRKIVMNQSSPWLSQHDNRNNYASGRNNNYQYNDHKNYGKNKNYKGKDRDSRYARNDVRGRQ